MTTICADCHQLLPNERSFGATVGECFGKLFPQAQDDDSDVTISVTATPAKQEDIISEILELFYSANTDNWDDEGAKAISTTALSEAIVFALMLPTSIRMPEVCPSSNGAIDFEWDFDDSRCNVEIFGDGKVVYAGYLAEDDREYGTKPFKRAIPKVLIDLLERMSEK